MSAAALPLLIERYATFRLDLQVRTPVGDGTQPHNISGQVPRMQIRPAKDSQDIWLELHTGNGRIQVLDAAQGLLRLQIAASVTATFGWQAAVYDLVLIAGAETRRLIEGPVVVSDGVTR
ncbi:hypothetical protein [Melaminivora sp.]|uniref:hypothetical protein n=1 Tax=Melaminivora sp. TaxID=1933032 RepID=UPI0028ADC111|nr:hypothetical protein [Melaminivora sp.]